MCQISELQSWQSCGCAALFSNGFLSVCVCVCVREDYVGHLNFICLMVQLACNFKQPDDFHFSICRYDICIQKNKPCETLGNTPATAHTHTHTNAWRHMHVHTPTLGDTGRILICMEHSFSSEPDAESQRLELSTFLADLWILWDPSMESLRAQRPIQRCNSSASPRGLQTIRSGCSLDCYNINQNNRLQFASVQSFFFFEMH